MRTEFGWILATVPAASIRIEFVSERHEVVDYSVVLLWGEEGEQHAVRLYDGSHGVNEMHRYTRSAGKEAAEVFHHGTLGEGMRIAIRLIEDGYEEMIRSWLRT